MINPAMYEVLVNRSGWGKTTVSELLARSMVPGESLGLSSRGGRDKINIVNKVYQDTD